MTEGNGITLSFRQPSKYYCLFLLSEVMPGCIQSIHWCILGSGIGYPIQKLRSSTLLQELCYLVLWICMMMTTMNSVGFLWHMSEQSISMQQNCKWKALIMMMNMTDLHGCFTRVGIGMKLNTYKSVLWMLGKQSLDQIIFIHLLA